jgi:hypothetical protein
VSQAHARELLESATVAARESNGTAPTKRAPRKR